MAFSNEQLERYSRHIILKEVGAKGQKKQIFPKKTSMLNTFCAMKKHRLSPQKSR